LVFPGLVLLRLARLIAGWSFGERGLVVGLLWDFGDWGRTNIALDKRRCLMSDGGGRWRGKLNGWGRNMGDDGVDTEVRE